MPRCNNHECKEKFTATYFLEKYCKKDGCKEIEARLLLEKARAKQKKAKDDAWKAEKAKHVNTLETLPEAKNKLQIEINHIARLIDKDVSCMMCNTPNYERKNGCHYHSVGSNDTIRFNLLNIHIGCHSCNGEKGGNQHGYDLRLIDVYGRERWELIKFTMVSQHKYLGITKQECHEVRAEAMKIVKELKKSDLVYPVEMRWSMRESLNKRLGLYL